VIFGRTKSLQDLDGSTVELVTKMEFIDPDLSFFLKDSLYLCEKIIPKDPERILKKAFKKHIKLPHESNDERGRIFQQRLKEMVLEDCDPRKKEEFLGSLKEICDDPDSKNTSFLSGTKQEELSKGQKIAYASLKCSVMVKYGLTGSEVNLAESRRDQNLSRTRAIKESTKLIKDGGVTKLSENIKKDILSSGGLNSARKNFSSMIAAARSSGVKSVSQELTSDVLTPSGQVSSPITEPSFSEKMNQIVNQSNRNTGNYNSTQSATNYSQMIDNSNIGDKEVMERLDEDKGLARNFQELEKKLRNKLGSDSANKLIDTLAGKKDISKQLAGEEDLKRQVAALKAQLEASVKKKKSDEVASASKQEIDRLNEENKKLKNVIAAANVKSSSPVSNNVQSNTQSGSGGSFGGGSSGVGNYQQSYEPVEYNGIPTQVGSNATGRIPATVLKSLNTYVNNKKFDLGLRGDNLVLTIDGKGVERSPIEIASVARDTNGVVQQFVVKGSKTAINVASLTPESRVALQKYLLKNKDLAQEQIQKNLKEIASVTKIMETAKEDSVRYDDFLLKVKKNLK
ncbi:MAG: hypothetical protein HON90_07295, partial [Halobacteriovoraceae bacterium]|nr:hypothetical protein [Halobacteriovoraceae bacterium]